MPVSRKISAAAIIYSAWLMFFILNYYFEFINLPLNVRSYVFLGAAGLCMITAAVKIAELQYSPFILIVFFLFCGRLTAFAADFISMSLTGQPLFYLPFGGLDFFVYHLLLIGLLRYISLTNEPADKKFIPAVLTPLILLILPVFIDVYSKSSTSVIIYSFVFTGFAVWSMASALFFGQRYPKMRILAYAAGSTVVFDMLIYIEHSGVLPQLPEKLNYLLLPYAMFLLAYAVSSVSRGDIDD